MSECTVKWAATWQENGCRLLRSHTLIAASQASQLSLLPYISHRTTALCMLGWARVERANPRLPVCLPVCLPVSFSHSHSVSPVHSIRYQPAMFYQSEQRSELRAHTQHTAAALSQRMSVTQNAGRSAQAFSVYNTTPLLTVISLLPHTARPSHHTVHGPPPPDALPSLPTTSTRSKVVTCISAIGQAGSRNGHRSHIRYVQPTPTHSTHTAMCHSPQRFRRCITTL